MKGRTVSLSVQIIILCLSLVFAISALISILTLSNISKVSDSNLRSTAKITMQYLDADIQIILASPLDITTNTAAIIESVPREFQKTILEKMLATDDQVPQVLYASAVSRLEEGGYILYATDYTPAADYDQTKRGWFKTALNNPGRTVFTAPYIDTRTKKLCVSTVSTTSAGGTEISGVICTDVFLGVLTDIITRRKITTDGNTFLVDKDGLFLVYEDESFVLEKNFFDEEIGTIAPKEEILSGSIDVTVLGDRYLVSSPLTGTDWFLVSTGRTHELTGNFRSIVLLTIIAVLAAAAAAILIALCFSAILSRSFKKLGELFTVISSGDFTRESPRYITKEADTLSVNFNQLMRNLKMFISAIQDSTDNLSGVGAELTTMMSESVAAIQEISASTQEMKSKVETQQKTVAGTNNTITEIISSITALNTIIAKQVDSISVSSAAVEEMTASITSVTKTLMQNEENVKNLALASEKGRVGLNDVSAAVTEVAKESEGLLEINAVIQAIASQTNLLSMNAAIEAAHAGEAGRGFAVVADEIRKLAESSSEQAKTVSLSLKKMKDSLDDINKSTGAVIGHFENIDTAIKTVAGQESSIRNAMEEQDTGSKEVLESTGKLQEITDQVKNRSEEMLLGSEKIVAQGKILETITGDMMNGMGEIASAFNHISVFIASIHGISQKNKENIEGLIREAGRFTV
jgi:methyl-accepting chemotaxis protein